MDINQYTNEAVELLQRLIATPSVSREEHAAADILADFIGKCGLPVKRVGNNILVQEAIDPNKPTLLLNAHIDTVKPVSTWTRDPFAPTIEDDDYLYGLGSNDCGGGLVSLLQVYRILRARDIPYNIVYLASCEEEVSGQNGFSLILPELPKIDVAIVGEPTGMQPAIAEKGLMVIDGVARGKSGHAARNEGVNAIYEALEDIGWFRTYQFPKVSEYLGPVKMSVTMISAGTQHNVVPDECRFVVDVRPNGMYSNQELLALIKEEVSCEVKERSTRIGSSHLPVSHPVVRRGLSLGLQPFGSPTTSNQALCSFPTLKIGPGDSSRSHGPDEYITLDEIATGVDLYVKLLDDLELN